MAFDLYLASQSPRRQELLNQIGVHFAVKVADIDETPLAAESAEEHVKRLAFEKANTIAQSLSDDERRPVLGADTIVVIDGQILGKPTDRQAAIEMLTSLSGKTHQVMTAVVLISEKHSVCVNVSEVSFRPLDPAEIESYWDSGEPRDKAGAYAIQGMAASFISELKGSYSGVMGLPLYETSELLAKHKVPVWQNKT